MHFFGAGFAESEVPEWPWKQPFGLLHPSRTQWMQRKLFSLLPCSVQQETWGSDIHPNRDDHSWLLHRALLLCTCFPNLPPPCFLPSPVCGRVSFSSLGPTFWIVSESVCFFFFSTCLSVHCLLISWTKAGREEDIAN